MTKIDDGGAAFPGEQGYTPQGWNQTWEHGMSLRQWYAGLALQGLLAFEGPWVQGGELIGARIAIAHADALIAELGKDKP